MDDDSTNNANKNNNNNNNNNSSNKGVVWDGQLPSAEELAAQLHPGDYPPMEIMEDHDDVVVGVGDEDDAYLFHEFDDDHDHDHHSNHDTGGGGNQQEDNEDDGPPQQLFETLPPYNNHSSSSSSSSNSNNNLYYYSPQYIYETTTRPRTTSEGGLEGVDHYRQHHDDDHVVNRSNSFGKFSALTAAAVAAKPSTQPSPIMSTTGGGGGGGGGRDDDITGVYQRQTSITSATTTSNPRSLNQPLPPRPALPAGVIGIRAGSDNYKNNTTANGIEKTGRWTKEEHEAFLVGLKLYGKEWKKVADIVKTRTVIQTRTHAQKYFQKVAKGGGEGGAGGDTDAYADARMKYASGSSTAHCAPLAHSSPLKITKPDDSQPSSSPIMATKSPKSPSTKRKVSNISSDSKQQQQQPYQEPIISSSDNHPSIIRSYSSEAASGLITMFNDRRALGSDFLSSTNPTILGDMVLSSSDSVDNSFSFGSGNNDISQFNSSVGGGGFGGGLSIVAPTYEDMIAIGKFPEPSPAACGKRKMDEIAAAQMLAGGVMGLSSSNMHDVYNNSSNNNNYYGEDDHTTDSTMIRSSNSAIISGTARANIPKTRSPSLTEYLSGVFDDITPPPPPVADNDYSSVRFPNSPFSAAAAAIANAEYSSSLSGGGRGLLQIVNPDTFGEHKHSEYKRRYMNGAASPITPWDGQLEALIGKVKSQEPSHHHPPAVRGEPQSSLDHFLATTTAAITTTTTAEMEVSVNDEDTASIIMPNTILPLPLRNPMTDLQLAICKGSVIEVNKICSHMVAAKSPSMSLMINQRDGAGYFPLHSAVALCLLDDFGLNRPDSFEICQLLIDNGADVTCRDKDGNTAVHWASRAGHVGVLGLLLVRNCPLDVQNNVGETALHWAMRAGERGAEAVKVLVENGARVNVFNRNFRRPLDVAAEEFVGLQEGSDSSLTQNKTIAICKPDSRERRAARWNLMECSSQSRTLVLYHQECLEHLAKSDADWEVPDRIENIMTTLTTRTVDSCLPDDELSFKPCEVTISNEFERATLELLSRVHSAEYLAFVNDLSKELDRKRKQQVIEGAQQIDGGVPEEKKPRSIVPFTPMIQRKMIKRTDSTTKADINSDTAFSAGSLKAARRAAGAVQHAVDCVLVGRNRNAFCIVRPPGHHAGINGLLSDAESCGFCLFNNVAAGAMHALSDDKHRPRCERCAIVDIDAHHGNGTEEIVRKCHDSGRLLFFSVHLYDHDKPNKGNFQYKFYPGTGAEDEVARNIINVPIAPLWREKEVVKSISLASNGGKPNKQLVEVRQTRQRCREEATPQRVPSLPDLSKFRDDESAAPDIVLKQGSSSSGTTSLETTSLASDSSHSTKPRAPLPSASPHYPPHYLMGVGRLAYRRAIQHRLLPALRAFNPDLIILSTGFDAARGDVGNARHYVNGTQAMGLDLEPEDYAWTARKVCEVADICCNGRVVSVLEGGYGRTAPPNSSPLSSVPTPPLSVVENPATEPDRQKLDKSFFSECAMQHLKGLVDPYFTDEQEQLTH